MTLAACGRWVKSISGIGSVNCLWIADPEWVNLSSLLGLRTWLKLDRLILFYGSVEILVHTI